LLDDATQKQYYIPMTHLKTKAYAKINLSLNVTGVQENLHTLDMIMTTIDLYDDISITKRHDNKININYINGKNTPDDIAGSISVGFDSVTRAVLLFKDKLDAKLQKNFGVDIKVIKNIPLNSGLGGSGVDAAAVFVALQKMYATDFALEQLAKQVGSDCTYQLRGGYARVEGVGDKITFLNCNRIYHIVVAMGRRGVLSKDSFAAFDQMYPSKAKVVSDNDEFVKELLEVASPQDYNYKFIENALRKPSAYLNSSIIATLIYLSEAGARKAIMTGSGAACVGFFNNKADAQKAAKAIQASAIKDGCSVWAVATCTK